MENCQPFNPLPWVSSFLGNCFWPPIVAIKMSYPDVENSWFVLQDILHLYIIESKQWIVKCILCFVVSVCIQGHSNKGSLNHLQGVEPNNCWNLIEMLYACIIHHPACIHTTLTRALSLVSCHLRINTPPKSKTCICQHVPLGTGKNKEEQQQKHSLGIVVVARCCHTAKGTANLSSAVCHFYFFILTFHTWSAAGFLKAVWSETYGFFELPSSLSF